MISTKSIAIHISEIIKVKKPAVLVNPAEDSGAFVRLENGAYRLDFKPEILELVEVRIETTRPPGSYTNLSENPNEAKRITIAHKMEMMPNIPAQQYIPVYKDGWFEFQTFFEKFEAIAQGAITYKAKLKAMEALKSEASTTSLLEKMRAKRKSEEGDRGKVFDALRDALPAAVTVVSEKRGYLLNIQLPNGVKATLTTTADKLEISTVEVPVSLPKNKVDAMINYLRALGSL